MSFDLQIRLDRYNQCVNVSISIKKMAEANFPTIWGKFRIYGFEGHFDGIGERRKESAVALVMGDVLSTPPVGPHSFAMSHWRRLWIASLRLPTAA